MTQPSASPQSLLSPMLPQHWRHLWIAIAILIRDAAVIAAIHYLFFFLQDAINKLQLID